MLLLLVLFIIVILMLLSLGGRAARGAETEMRPLDLSRIAGLGKSSRYTVGDSASGAAVSAETQSPPTLQSLENSLDLPSARNADSG